MSNQLKAWMDKATPEQKKSLAKHAHTSLAALRQAAGAWRSEGLVNLTPAFAKRIELAAEVVAREHPGASLPLLKREDLCIACGQCEYALRCREAAQPINADK